MKDETLRIFRRLVREAQIQLAAETVPARRKKLQTVLVSCRLDLERYQREPALGRYVTAGKA
jgi:hypothetical protein